MSRLLILTRHAKSDWSAEARCDHERPLNSRGRRAAPLVGAALAARALVPDQILCSSATRTRQTWAGIAEALPPTPAPELHDSLYHASPDTMLAALRAATGQRVALIGHNPGIAALAALLVQTPPAHARFGHFPTGATLIAEVSDWARLAPGTARAVEFFVPRDLPDHP